MTNLRFQPVTWHTSPVYIPGISAKKHNTEFGFQIYTALWLKSHSHDGWHHSANENANSLQGVWNRLSGQSVGFPDWIHPESNTAVELKLPGKHPTQAQLIWLGRFKHSFVCRRFDEFEAAVKSTLTSTSGLPEYPNKS